ncbi:MAG: anti-sigma factor, partial [Longimicrobiales bacterium]|nr:anti-sigma factor [Longimicrobiales bacterium]
SGHRPHEGFVDRVMASVQVPEPRPLAVRLRDGLVGAFSAHEESHVAGEVLQDFLEGSLAARRSERIESHLARCSSCTREADAWLGLMRRLDELPSFRPAEGFADAVMAQVEVRERLPLAARIRQAIDSLVSPPTPEHVPAGVLQDFVDDALPAPAMARVEAHVDECGRCASELGAWRQVTTRLDDLGRFEPAPDFAQRVMTGLERAPAVAPATAWSGLLAAARRRVRRLVPETRQAVAALSGAAVTPTVVMGLAVWALWSHPTLTLNSLVSFVWWQVSDMAAGALGALSGVVTQSAEVFGVLSLLESLASAPALVAGGALAYTMICGLAVRVLYKNLIAHRSHGGRPPHASTAS